MLIANPIYDVVFKRLMENEKVAKFFIGTLLDQNIESLQIKPQEYTYKGELDLSDPQAIAELENRIRERYTIWVYRLDFIATVRTQSGELKKVLIEIQKTRNPIDLMRFRNYLAEQYKKQDVIQGEKVILPITTIYILGFKLPEIETACIKVERNYKDLINQTIIYKKSEFVEKLTHDSYIVQVERITDRYQTRLDKLLSVFGQYNFADDKEITKVFSHEVDIDELKLMTEILHYIGTEPAERKRIEDEQEAWRTISAMLESKQKELERALEELEAKEKELETEKRRAEAKERELESKEKELDVEKQRAETEKQRAQAEKQRAEAEKQRAEAEKRRAEAKERELETERRKIYDTIQKLKMKGFSVSEIAEITGLTVTEIQYLFE